jgi:hypothetical protein
MLKKINFMRRRFFHNQSLQALFWVFFAFSSLNNFVFAEEGMTAGNVEPSADEIRIQDFDGKPRAVNTVSDSGAFVDCTISDASGKLVDNVEVEISNIETQKKFARKTLDGRVRFQGLDGGTWRLASQYPGLHLQDVEVQLITANAARSLPMSAQRSIRQEFGVSPVAAGVTVAGIAGTAVAISSASDGSSSNKTGHPLPSPLSPSR